MREYEGSGSSSREEKEKNYATLRESRAYERER